MRWTLIITAVALAGCAGGARDDDGASTSSADSTPVKGPATTTWTAQLHAIGLDAANLPSLHDLDDGKKSKVMVTFTKTMGVSCDGCHDTSDFSASTPQKVAATFAWESISRGMTMADGGALYCDSCHNGKLKFLDRSDRGALMDWMQTNFVETLERKDGQGMSCASCHNPVPTLDGY